MNFSKHSLVASSLLLLLGMNSFADEVYTIQNKTLKEALEIISKKSNLSYIANDEVLDKKSTNNIQNIEGTQQALDKLLEGSGLKAIIDDKSIVIIQEQGNIKVVNGTYILDDVSVTSEKSGSAENGYLVKETKGVGIWNERKLQDTPYSMSIISKDLIENVQAKDMNQIFKMNPTTEERGQASSNVGDVQWPNIRGFRVQNPIINGISYANSISSAPMMQDIERVEIINGATGFLYGGGRVGGAVNYITKQPTTNDLRNLTIGSYGNESYYGHIDLGGQFNEDNTLGYRANAMYQDGKLSGNTETEQKAISLVFDWKPTDNFYMDTKYMYKDSLKKGVNSFFTSIDDRRSISKNEIYNPDWIQNEIKLHKVENNIKWNINDIFTFRTNLFYEKVKYRGDVSWITYKDNKVIGSQTNFYKYAWEETENNGVNLFLDSSFDTGNINHTITAGYSLNSSKLSIRDNNLKSSTLSTDMTLNDLKNLNESTWGGANSGILRVNSKREYSNILIGDDIVLNEYLSALVGVNYATVINKTYSNNTKYDKSELTPTLSFIYKPFEELTTYTTYIESLEAGTVVPTQYSNANEVLPPLVSKQYEVGAKYSLNESVLLTGALFRIEKANQYSDLSTPKPKYVQDGEQIHQGIELGITGKVTDDLTIIAGGTFMDIEVEKSNNKALEGKKPTEAASKMAKLYGEYNIPYVKGLFVTGGAYYTGKKYGNGLNTDIMSSYTLYDLGLRYKTKLDKYSTTFNINVQNLTDKEYWTNSWQLGDPRSVAFSMKMEF
ncbi:TonB-dependent siderophore receptor [Aliarcobacter lanthieri]|uniref:TonB-dependent siderophore receptor n=1 Tax=Aliarcobacter lanthieri TaxID=1355374 RepID=UPI003AFAD827